MPNDSAASARSATRWQKKPRTRNIALDLLVAAREKRGVITTRERRVAVQRLLKGIDPETDSALLKWLRAWSPPGAGKTKRRIGQNR